MSLDLGVNYLAVLVAAVATIVIGFVYYGPTGLGDRWMRMLGPTPPRVGPPAPAEVALGFVGGLVNAWVLSVLALNLGASSIADGIVLGVLAWLGFMATLTVAQLAFERRPWSLWALNNVHNVIIQAAMAVIVTIWR
jgi:hypothetical protein